MSLMFNELVGNSTAKKYLFQMVQTQRFGNSLLFAGPDGIGKGLYALEFAKAIIFQGTQPASQNIKAFKHHPDIHMYYPEGKIGMHSISSMRRLRDEIYLPPYEGSRKAFIIHDAERMLPDCSNALLKTFEEPTLDSLIILVSSSPDSLLPTIRSRCQVLSFHPIETELIATHLCTAYQLKPSEAEHIAKLSKGSLAKAIALMDPEVRQFDLFIIEILSGRKGSNYPFLIKAIKELNELLEGKKKEWAQLFEPEKNQELSPHQRETAQKEMDGVISLNTLRVVEDILAAVLGWYRDLHLIQASGNLRHLIYKDFQVELNAKALTQRLPALEDVMKKLAEARMAFTRSIPFQTVLETLLLSLKVIK